MIKKILITCVQYYQNILSPDHSVWAKALQRPPYCKHIPTCSEYMIESIQKKWATRWVFGGIMRIFRCMPWCKWGYDPVEKNKD